MKSLQQNSGLMMHLDNFCDEFHDFNNFGDFNDFGLKILKVKYIEMHAAMSCASSCVRTICVRLRHKHHPIVFIMLH